MSTKAEGPWGDTWKHAAREGDAKTLCGREVPDSRVHKPEYIINLVAEKKPGACPECWTVMCGEVVERADLERGRGVNDE